MQKVVNGKLTDVGDIRIFELGFEGLALNKLAVSNISITIDSETESIKSCIELYNKMYRSLPFPLYSIENNIKYASIAEYIKCNIKDKLEIWVNKGIFILVEKNKALKLVGNTWGVVQIEGKKEDNCDLELYKDDIGYTEFKWALNKLKDGKNLGSYYKEFMPDFLKSCGNNAEIIKKELNNILEFEQIPIRKILERNTLINVDTEDIFNLDIYLKGKVANGEKVTNIDLTRDDDNVYESDKCIPTFGYDIYKKSIVADRDLPDTVYYNKKCEVKNRESFDSVFENLLRIGMNDGRVSNLKVQGFIKGTYIIYEVENRIFKCKYGEYYNSIEIARGVEIYSIKYNKVYLLREQRMKNKIIKDIIYSFDLDTGTIKICKIGYR